MPGEVSPAGDLPAAEEALIVVVEMFGVEVLRKRGLAREVGVARMAPVDLHAVTDDGNAVSVSQTRTHLHSRSVSHAIARCQIMVCLHGNWKVAYDIIQLVCRTSREQRDRRNREELNSGCNGKFSARSSLAIVIL